MSIDFKGSQYPKSVVLYAVTFYLRYPVSYRDLEEIIQERGVDVDHASLNRWVIKYSPLLAEQARQRKRATGSSWRMDETYIKVKGELVLRIWTICIDLIRWIILKEMIRNDEKKPIFC